MTDAPDYGEPWKVSEDCDVRDSGGYLIWSQRQSPFVFKEQIHRAIACVNACRGIKDPETVVPLLVAAAVSMLKYAKDKTFYPMMEECQFVEHLTKLSVAIAALQPKREGE